MRSTSCSEIAEEVLERCIAGEPPAALPRTLLSEPCGHALFGILAEGLADRFEASLSEPYANLFSQAVAHAVEGLSAAALVARYQRVRRPRPVGGEPRQVYVLSRVTLGADVAVTSVLLDAAKRRFPYSTICFVGPDKNYELFAGDPRIRHVPVAYRRGGLRERLGVWEELKTVLDTPGSVLIDPDSRLTQLGLLPVCPEESHHLFESRAYGADSDRTLTELATEWAGETFGVVGSRPYLALPKVADPPAVQSPGIAISLGVGENLGKRMADPFEEKLLAMLAQTGQKLFIDRGAGGEESARVTQAVERAAVTATFWEGSFAGFARIIARSRLYVGYDSAGQHVASACRVPQVTVFAGFPVPRMYDRWRPTGKSCRVVRVNGPAPDVAETLAEVQSALQDLEGAVLARSLNR